LHAITAPAALTTGAILFAAVFSTILNGRTPLVGIFARAGTLKLAVREGPFSPKATHTDLDGTPIPLPDEPIKDEVDTSFGLYLQRSREAAHVAQRRPNALLFVGTVIAILGLVFFVVTLPGGRYTLPFSSVTVRAGLVTMTAPGLLPPGPPWSAPRSSSARPRRAPELLQRAGSTTRANGAQLGRS
jgi:hypothetical protein